MVLKQNQGGCGLRVKIPTRPRLMLKRCHSPPLVVPANARHCEILHRRVGGVKLYQLTDNAGTKTRQVRAAWKGPKAPMTYLEKMTLCPHCYGWPWNLAALAENW